MPGRRAACTAARLVDASAKTRATSTDIVRDFFRLPAVGVGPTSWWSFSTTDFSAASARINCPGVAVPCRKMAYENSRLKDTSTASQTVPVLSLRFSCSGRPRGYQPSTIRPSSGPPAMMHVQTIILLAALPATPARPRSAPRALGFISEPLHVTPSRVDHCYLTWNGGGMTRSGRSSPREMQGARKHHGYPDRRSRQGCV